MIDKQPRRRNVDPELARLRTLLGVAHREGRTDEAQQLRGQLTRARVLVDLRRAAQAALAEGAITETAAAAVLSIAGGVR